MTILDSHCDTPSSILRFRDISKDGEHSHVDVPKLRRGGIDAVFFALYTPPQMVGDEATAYALKMLSASEDAIEENAGDLRKACSPSDIASNKEKGLVSILYGMENGSPIQKSLPLLRQFYRMGVRYMTLTHNSDNEIADSAAEGKKWHGLSPFGREVIHEMNRIGMLVDVAHCSDETFYDCLEASSAPIVSTHSCCRALAGHRRNMTDDMIRRLADKGGVIQINFYPCFLSEGFAALMDRIEKEHPEFDEADAAFRADPSSPEKRRSWEAVMDYYKTLPRPGVGRIAEHIEHAVKVGGIEHVGIGSDFDGIDVTPEGLDDISYMPVLFDELGKRRLSEDEIDKIAGGNFLRVMRDVEIYKTKN